MKLEQLACCIAMLIGLGTACKAQDTTSKPEDVSVRDFRPQSMLRVKKTPLFQAKYPCIDIHTHFGRRLDGSAERLAEFVEVMNRHQIAVCVSLDASLGTEADHRDYLYQDYEDRFMFFVNIDWRGAGLPDQPSTWDCHRAEFPRRVAEQLKIAREAGACGLKLFKGFGLGYRNPDGSLIRIDDRRWDPIWLACGELGLPVIIHTADPAAFFLPIDRFNERWEELSRHPDWSFYGSGFPARHELLEARNRVIERHPGTIFIGAHIANNAEDLATVSEWLDRYPNLYIEPASRISELGRQPFTAREFLTKYQDRVMFGTDGPWPELRLTYYWRFMETHDEYFPYSEKEPPPQGLWQIYGVKLPDEVLKKIYFENACRIIPGMREKYDKSVRQLSER